MNHTSILTSGHYLVPYLLTAANPLLNLACLKMDCPTRLNSTFLNYIRGEWNKKKSDVQVTLCHRRLCNSVSYQLKLEWNESCKWRLININAWFNNIYRWIVTNIITNNYLTSLFPSSFWHQGSISFSVILAQSTASRSILTSARGAGVTVGREWSPELTLGDVESVFSEELGDGETGVGWTRLWRVDTQHLMESKRPSRSWGMDAFFVRIVVD